MLNLNEFKNKWKEIDNFENKKLNLFQFNGNDVPSFISALVIRIKSINNHLELLNQETSNCNTYKIETSLSVTSSDKTTRAKISITCNNEYIFVFPDTLEPFYKLENFDYYELNNSPLLGDADFPVIEKIYLSEKPNLYCDILEDKIFSRILNAEKQRRMEVSERIISSILLNKAEGNTIPTHDHRPAI